MDRCGFLPKMWTLLWYKLQCRFWLSNVFGEELEVKRSANDYNFNQKYNLNILNWHNVMNCGFYKTITNIFQLVNAFIHILKAICSFWFSKLSDNTIKFLKDCTNPSNVHPFSRGSSTWIPQTKKMSYWNYSVIK